MNVTEELERREAARRHQERVDRARGIYGEAASKAVKDTPTGDT